VSYAIRVKVQDGASNTVRALNRVTNPKTLSPIVGRSATNTIREHLFGLNQSRPNQLGGRRTQFYAQAARSTHFDEVPGGVLISINQVGIAQRYYGGEIKPKKGKYLTIPVHPAAYGKRAGEMDLEVVFGHDGRPIALATKDSRGVSVRQTKSGKITKTQTGHRGEIMFRLVRSVNQKPDETVLPYDELIYARIERDVNQVIDRAIERGGGAT
jgi:hypothetical protein